MVSCGADKSIIFREVSTDRRGLPEFAIVNHVVGKTTLYDMEVDASRKHVLTACQDRNIRVYTVSNGKHSRYAFKTCLKYLSMSVNVYSKGIAHYLDGGDYS